MYWKFDDSVLVTGVNFLDNTIPTESPSITKPLFFPHAEIFETALHTNREAITTNNETMSFSFFIYVFSVIKLFLSDNVKEAKDQTNCVPHRNAFVSFTDAKVEPF